MYKHNKYTCIHTYIDPLGRINASGIEWLIYNSRAGLRGYVQINKYTYIHTNVEILYHCIRIIRIIRIRMLTSQIEMEIKEDIFLHTYNTYNSYPHVDESAKKPADTGTIAQSTLDSV